MRRRRLSAISVVVVTSVVSLTLYSLSYSLFYAHVESPSVASATSTISEPAKIAATSTDTTTEETIILSPPLPSSLSLTQTASPDISATNVTVTTSVDKTYWRPDLKWVQNCINDLESSPSSSKIEPFPVIWRRYVLGDCIKLCRNCYNRKCVRHPEKAKQKGTGCFEQSTRNDTFAALYYFRACKTDQHVIHGNLTIVDNIIQEAAEKDPTSYKIPNSDTLVIHLRLGDVIENSKATVEDMLMQGADPWHSEAFQTAIKSIDEYLSDIESSGLQKIEIRGGSHDPNYFYKSRLYAGCLHRAIQFAGYSTATMHLGGADPDHDFFYTSHSKHLIVSAGGYSRLIGTMVKRNGGEVIGREFLNLTLDTFNT